MYMGRRWFRRRDDDVEIRCGNIRKFSYESLQIATNNFSKDMLIGQGGFAKIYKGNLSNGIQVAVKYFSSQELRREEFLDMVEALSQTRHRNIVQVFGCCIHKDRLLLVTEYVANGSLCDQIEDVERRKSSDFNWNRRSAICVEIARGLSYLHEDAIPRLIHMDINPTNILLDHNFTPKIIDFDLMKSYYDLDESELPHETDRRIAGTYGYMAPEYLLQGHYSEKSDVFAFGVVMLEIIGGRRAMLIGYEYGKEYIIDWASKLVKNDRVLEIIDPLVLTDLATDVAQSFIDVALLCVQRDPKLRPRMVDVTHMLYGVCNSSTLLIRRPDMLMLYDGSNGTYYWQDEEQEHSVNFSAVTWTSTEAEDTLYKGQCSIAQNDSSFRSSISDANDEGEGETESAYTDTELQAQREIEGVEVHVHQQHMGIILSGSGNLVERLSQTMVFKKSTELDFPEAVYPPFRTRVFRRGGSRNLYTF